MKSQLKNSYLFLSIIVLLFLARTDVNATELKKFPLDWYVRHSDLIADVKVTGKEIKDDFTLVHAEILATHLGTNEGTINIAVFDQGPIDYGEPSFAIGDESIIFLKHGDSPYQSYFVGVGGYVGKIDFTGDTLGFTFIHFDARYHSKTKSKTEFLKDFNRFVHVKTEINQDKKKALLIGILNSDNTFLVTAACDYLNYLVNGQDYLEWQIKPPQLSGDWNFQEYYDKNAMYQKAKWLKWWEEQNYNP